MDTDRDPRPAEPAPREGAGPAPARLDSAALLDGRPEVEIAHEGELYRLRRTRAGKLILTK